MEVESGCPKVSILKGELVLKEAGIPFSQSLPLGSSAFWEGQQCPQPLR